MFANAMARTIQDAVSPSVISEKCLPLTGSKRKRQSVQDETSAFISCMNSIAKSIVSPPNPLQMCSSSKNSEVNKSSHLLANQDLEDRAIQLTKELALLPEGPVKEYVKEKLDIIVKALRENK